jgi:hypothetical protein
LALIGKRIGYAHTHNAASEVNSNEQSALQCAMRLPSETGINVAFETQKNAVSENNSNSACFPEANKQKCGFRDQQHCS